MSTTFLTGVPGNEAAVVSDVMASPNHDDDVVSKQMTPNEERKADEAYQYSENRNDPADEARFHAIQKAIAGVTEMSQSTMLIQKRREMSKVDALLRATKDKYDARMQKCFERQRRFEKKQGDMKGQVEKFKKFIHENNHKRQRADQKEKSEIKARFEQTKIAKEEEVRLKETEAEFDLLQKKLKKVLCYQEYLEAVVENSQEAYDEVSHVLDRHKALLATRTDLEAAVAAEVKKLEEMRLKLSALRRDAQKGVLVKQGHIHRMQKNVEEQRSLSFQADMQREAEQSSSRDKSRVLSQVLLAIKNVHSRCVATSRSQRSRRRRSNAASGGSMSKAKKIKNENNDGKEEKNELQQIFSLLEVIGMRMTILMSIRDEYGHWKEQKRQEKIALGTGDESMKVQNENTKSKSDKRETKSRSHTAEKIQTPANVSQAEAEAEMGELDPADDGFIEDSDEEGFA